MSDCIFCKIIAKEIPAYIVDENDDVIVFLSLENHPLVVTKKHVKDIYELSEADGAAVMKETVKISQALKKSLQCEGITLVQSNEAAGQQQVFHFHLHVRPRWLNDNMKLHWPEEVASDEAKTETVAKIKAAL